MKTLYVLIALFQVGGHLSVPLHAELYHCTVLFNDDVAFYLSYITWPCIIQSVELAWRSGSVMDCHATARGSIPVGNGVKTELHVLRKGQSTGVPSLNVKHNQPTNHPIKWQESTLGLYKMIDWLIHYSAFSAAKAMAKAM